MVYIGYWVCDLHMACVGACVWMTSLWSTYTILRPIEARCSQLMLQTNTEGLSTFMPIFTIPAFLRGAVVWILSRNHTGVSCGIRLALENRKRGGCLLSNPVFV